MPKYARIVAMAVAFKEDAAALFFGDVDIVLSPTTAVLMFAAEGLDADHYQRSERTGDGRAVHHARQPVLEPGYLGCRRGWTTDALA